MASSSSSTKYSGATAAPPPTPSSQTNNQASTPDASDLLSRLLHRLQPTLSLPTRRTTSSAPPTVSFQNASPEVFLNQQHGYFQLVDHPIPPQLARSAESDSVSLFDLAILSGKWPIGFDYDEDGSQSFCVDASSATECDLNSLAELIREMEKIGSKMIELMSTAAGFQHPTRDLLRSLLWVSKSGHDQVLNMGRVYPYVVGLTYQLRSQHEYSLLGDSGWVTVSPRVESVLVAVGDIAQVWSNGLFKKVRGTPVPNMGGDSSDNNENSHSCITMTLLMTLEADSIVRPLTAKRIEDSEPIDETESSTSSHTCHDNPVFKPFPFEDYAWRVYNERIILKDPLDRYRI